MSNTSDKNSLIIYRRILRFDELFSAQTYPSLQEFLDDEEISASRTTIFRTRQMMQDQPHDPLVFDKAKNGSCYSEKTFRLPSMWTSEQELFAVTLMQDMSSKLKGTPLYKSANSILDYLQKNTVRNPNEREYSNRSNDHEATNLDWIKDRYIFLNASNFTVEEKTWDTVEHAMKVCKQIEFEYNYEKENRWVKIIMEPYQVINSSNRWYVWGYNPKTKQKTLFLLDLIRAVKIIPKEFKLPKNFDFRNYSSGVFGAFHGDIE